MGEEVLGGGGRKLKGVQIAFTWIGIDLSGFEWV